MTYSNTKYGTTAIASLTSYLWNLDTITHTDNTAINTVYSSDLTLKMETYGNDPIFKSIGGYSDKIYIHLINTDTFKILGLDTIMTTDYTIYCVFGDNTSTTLICKSASDNEARPLLVDYWMGSS